MLKRYGIYMPVKIEEVRDGDTVEVSLPGSMRRYAIRPIGLDCPESNEPGGPEATAFVKKLLEGAESRISLFVPFDQTLAREPLKLLTFDRIPGELYVGDERLTEIVVRAGHGKYDPRFQ